MKQFKLFIENFVVYGMGNVISKIIPLIMLPIVTRLMPDTYYFGLNDIYNVVVSFASAIALCGLYDATFRLFFDKEDLEYKKRLCSTALLSCITFSIIIGLLFCAFKDTCLDLFFDGSKNEILVYMAAISIIIGASNNLVASPVRMQNKRGLYILLHTLSSAISYAISIPLLIKGYYVIALPLSGILASLSIEIVFVMISRSWFSLRYFDKNLLKDLLKIGLPLMPGFLVYWVFSSADRLMISRMLGNDIDGIYAVGAKVAQISQMIYMAFAAGWQYFAFSTMEDNDQVKVTSNIFEYLMAVSFFAVGGICCFDHIIFSVFFEGDYVHGEIVAPYLFMAPLLQMLFQIATTQFTIIKKTWPILLILSFGALCNIVCNWFGIQWIGMEGAAISTLVGYSISLIIAIGILVKIKLLNLSIRSALAFLVFLAFLLVWRFSMFNFWILLGLGFVCILIYYLLYRKDIITFVRSLRNWRGSSASN